MPSLSPQRGLNDTLILASNPPPRQLLERLNPLSRKLHHFSFTRSDIESVVAELNQVSPLLEYVAQDHIQTVEVDCGSKPPSPLSRRRRGDLLGLRRLGAGLIFWSTQELRPG